MSRQCSEPATANTFYCEALARVERVLLQTAAGIAAFADIHPDGSGQMGPVATVTAAISETCWSSSCSGSSIQKCVRPGCSWVSIANVRSPVACISCFSGRQ